MDTSFRRQIPYYGVVSVDQMECCMVELSMLYLYNRNKKASGWTTEYENCGESMDCLITVPLKPVRYSYLM